MWWLVMQVASAACLTVSGTIQTANGPLSTFTVDDGVVVTGAAGCDTLVLEPGQLVTPGFVATGTHTGLTEIGAVDATNQADSGGHPVRAALTVVDAYNPFATHIPVTRIDGVTHAVVFPQGGLIAGQAGLVRLTGDTQQDAVVERSVGMVGGWDRHAARTVRLLSQLFDDAAYLRRTGSAVDRNATRELSAHPTDLRALWPVIDGEMPLVVSADKAADIEVLLRFADERGLRIIIDGAAEGWRHADALAQAGVPVIVDPTVFGPGGFDQRQARPDNAALMSAAGVPVIIGHVGTHNARLVAHQAGVAVGQGMSRELALAAVTTVPVAAFGQSGGDLSVGTSGSFVVWQSVTPDLPTDPFEPTTRAVAVYVDGVAQPMRSRQTELRDRYLTLPGSPLSPMVP